LHVFIVNQAIKGRAKSEKRACCQRVGKIKFIMKTKVLLGGLAIAIFAQVGCKKDIPNPEGQKVPGQQSFSIAASHPEETTDVLAALETFFEGVVADNLEDMNYHQAVWTVEAALNFAYRRSQGPFDTYLLDSLYVSLNNPEDEMDGSQIRQIFLDLKETIDQNTAGMEFGGVAYVDVTPAANLDWHVTVVFANYDPWPVTIPNIGDWRAIRHNDCSAIYTDDCSTGNSGGSKIADLVNILYYYDLYSNYGIDVYKVHFHTGIFSVGTGSTLSFRCGKNYPSDVTLSYTYDWGLYGNFNRTIGPNSSDPNTCLYQADIEDFANYIYGSLSTNYNPGGGRKLFFYDMGFDVSVGSSPHYKHTPAIMKFGNFHYIDLNEDIHGF
jgi:hypothetical protein